jgi:hypothetical protein
MSLVVGIDFDNTIATYDRLFHALALERDLIDGTVPHSKRRIRDAVRLRDEGELHWQQLQASAYGRHMAAAALAPGVGEFLMRCREAGVTVYVISHRSSHAAADPDGVPLRAAALDWMRAHGLFGSGGLGVREEDVFFASTRAEKLVRIGTLACSHFVDDLEEVLLEPEFPSGVVRILYAPERDQAEPVLDGVRIVNHWSEVREVVFGRR